MYASTVFLVRACRKINYYVLQIQQKYLLTLHLYKWQEQEMDRRGRGNPAGTTGHKGQALATIRDCLLSPCGSVSRNTINGTRWLSELAAAVGTFLHRGLLGEPLTTLTARAMYSRGLILISFTPRPHYQQTHFSSQFWFIRLLVGLSGASIL